MNRARGVLSAAFALALGCSPSPRDVVPESHDVRGEQPDAGASSTGYAYVTKRPHGVVALAEARHMTDAEAEAFVDRLADAFESCAAALDEKGALAPGAARVVAVAGPDGTPALNVRIAPGDATLQNALLCLLAPIRATPLPVPTASGAAGIAIEATWTPLRRNTP